MEIEERREDETRAKKREKNFISAKQHSSSITHIDTKKMRFEEQVNTRISRLLIRLRNEAASF